MEARHSNANCPYQALDRERDEIRLFQIIPSRYLTSQLHVQTRIASLREHPYYECISYCWGSPSAKSTILMDAQTMRVPSNLEIALRVFRTIEKHEIWFWADSICINQSDDEERNYQVSLMAKIYTNAATVRAWPESEADNFHRQSDTSRSKLVVASINILEQFADPKLTNGMSDEWLRSERFGEQLFAFCDFFSWSFWRRMWITQELILNSNVDVHVGYIRATLSEKSKWTFVLQNITKVSIALREARLALTARTWPIDPEEFSKLESGHEDLRKKSEMLDGALLSVLRLASGEFLLMEERSMSATLTPIIPILQGSQATLEHDYVYAMMGLLDKNFKIEPDYTRPYQHVYAEHTVKMIQVTSSLSWLQYAMSETPGLPSWCIDYSKIGPKHIAPDDLVDDTIYSAAAGIELSLEVQSKDAIKLDGLILDEIEYLSVVLSCEVDLLTVQSDLATQLQNIRSCLPLTLDQEISPALTRILVQDSLFILKMLEDPPSDAIGRLTEGDVQRWQHLFSCERRDLEESDLRMYDTIMNHVSTKRLCCTTKGYIGLVEKTAEKGDKICVLGGCNFPLCVRSTVKTGEPAYKLINVCYIDGMMDGQAQKMQSSLKVEKIRLV